LTTVREYRHSLFTDEPAVGNLVSDFPRYVDTLSGLLLQSEPKFTIGIFGNWGTGKTTLLKNIEFQLEDKGYNCLWFNAWKYEQEPAHIAIPLILSILLKIYKENKSQIDNWRDEDSSRRENLTERLHQVVSGLSLKMTFGVPGIANVDLGYDFSKPVDKKILGIPDMRYRLQQYRAEQTKVHEGIDLIVKLVGSKNIKGYGKNGQLKLVVFIDDLDRCTPEKAAEIFEIIKVFLDITGIIFVLGLSNKIIELALQERYKYLKDQFQGSDYLKKIIQLPVNIPQWKPDDITVYIQSLLQGYDDYTLKEIFRENVDMIVQGVESNPREVKRFLNLFILLYPIQSDIMPKHLLAIQAIKLRWEWFYDAIIAEMSFLKELYQYLFVNKSPAEGTPQSETIGKVLKEKALVDFLKGEGKIIFEIEFKEWHRYKKAEVRDIKEDYSKSQPEKNQDYFLQEDFSKLSKEKQEEGWALIARNPDFAERFGFSLGSPTSFNKLNKETQDRVWSETKRNEGFSKGLGASLGGNYLYLDKEMQDILWDKVNENTIFASSFGRSLAPAFMRLEPDVQSRVLSKAGFEGDFAGGLADGFAQEFPGLDEGLRNTVWQFTKRSDEIAERFGFSLGDTSFKKLDKETQERVWQEARVNESFGKGLALSLGKKFSLLDNETQERLWQQLVGGSDTFRLNFGESLGENFTLLDKKSQDVIWKMADSYPKFADGLALSLGPRLGLLDKPTRETAMKHLDGRIPRPLEPMR
jgi:hypothetical protein